MFCYYACSASGGSADDRGGRLDVQRLLSRGASMRSGSGRPLPALALLFLERDCASGVPCSDLARAWRWRSRFFRTGMSAQCDSFHAHLRCVPGHPGAPSRLGRGLVTPRLAWFLAGWERCNFCLYELGRHAHARRPLVPQPAGHPAHHRPRLFPPTYTLPRGQLVDPVIWGSPLPGASSPSPAANDLPPGNYNEFIVYVGLLPSYLSWSGRGHGDRSRCCSLSSRWSPARRAGTPWRPSSSTRAG